MKKHSCVSLCDSLLFVFQSAVTKRHVSYGCVIVWHQLMALIHTNAEAV